MGKFSGKNILIVGGSSGIGLELVHAVLHEGGNVFVASRSFPQELQDLKVPHFHLDVATSDLESLSSIPDQLDGLAYCPGTINLKPFARLSLDDFKNDFQVNVLGAVQVLQFIIPRLKKSGSSSVVLYSTVASSLGMPFHASVSASKSAVEGLAKSLAAEFATNKIRFNVVAPSLTNTPLAKQLLSTPEKIDASNKRHPLGRIGESADISQISSFLLSDESSWITGQVF
ncbi:MAG: SDR family oxidoreductase, partial [Cytophagales bacterium]|nr:SDR family oxidoreductase [Cytophagales bacterium]